MVKKDNKKNFLSYGLIICFFLAIFIVFNSLNAKPNVLTYDEFMKNLNDGKVTELELTPRQSSSVYEVVGKLDGYSKNQSFEIKVPYSDSIISQILNASDNGDLKVDINKDPDGSSIWTIIINFLPFVLLIGFAFYFLTRQVGGANKSLDFGKSKAKLHSDKDKVTFDNVAGLVEEKYEVKELIDFLKSPKKFQKLGARIPKGVLLVGPPGTGKTLLARAVAGEANVPFYYISGSDFVELFVGVGASRVRDMFKQAKQTAPCLIFIDEIDAVGRQRGTGLGGGHDEREQTLNQLLTEMDGFGANEGIIIIAATNRPDVLDPALLRPGRFDRQVTVSLPDVGEREAILKVHAKNKVLAKDVTLKYLASRTSGFSGADLENLLNEAALLAVRRNKTEITMSEVDEAHDRVLMGPAKKSRKVSEKDKKITAYHEAGHVVAGLKQENSNIVQKVTIIPRGMAGGYTNIQSEEEKMHTTRNELIETICTLLAGRVAEQITFDDITTGAENDIERATKIARAMVCEYGMSELGPVQLEQSESSVFLGRDYNKTRNFSDKIAFEIDQQIRKIIDGCYAKTERILNENRELLDLIAINLAKYETLTKEQIEYLVENGHMKDEEYSDDNNYNEMSISELKDIAKDKGIKGYSKMNKEELVNSIKDED
ncbi:MAG: ATP-dependent zinc metalloprotease FtsH [Bacilli bacterium]